MLERGNHRHTWATYQLAWEDVSAGERLRLLEASVTDGFEYSDALDLTVGRLELIAHVEGFRKETPGATFQNVRFLEQHGQSVAEWTLYDYDEVAVPGISYARYATDGRLEFVAGFFAARPTEGP